MSIATKSGDDGTTGAADGTRLPKCSARIAAAGTIDELNAYLGVIQTLSLTDALHPIVKRIQNDLFVVGADVGMPRLKGVSMAKTVVEEALIAALDEDLAALEPQIPPLKTFIVPGGSPGAAHLHYARTLCRRAERKAVLLGRDEEMNPLIVVYLNRLSDLLFTMARWLNYHRGVSDQPWTP